MNTSVVGLKARHVFPIVRPPIENGMVAIQDGRIVDVGRRVAAGRVIDLGDSAILPGLINCHTHLEFSHLSQPVAPPSTPFVDWIGAVLRERRSRTQTPSSDAAIEAGLGELCESSTAAVGEIATQADWPADIHKLPLRGIRFLELIGTHEDRQSAARAMAENYVAASSPARWKVGLSPHAPYTVAMSLLHWTVEHANRHSLPIAMHLAETQEEIELIRHQTGPLRTFLESAEMWDDSAIPDQARCLTYLQQLSKAPRVLVIHGNYLDRDEMALLASHRNSMSLVYCPRTHAYFGHQAYPLADLVKLGVRVVLGTDSRASNPDLNLFEEGRWVANNHAVDPGKVLELMTRDGAFALGLAETHGILAKGVTSNLCVVRLAPSLADPYEALFAADSQVSCLDPTSGTFSGDVAE